MIKVDEETGQGEFFREVNEMKGDIILDLVLEMPGEYIIESVTNGVQNEPVTLCFNEEWLQTCLALGKAQIRDGIARTTLKGSIVPQARNPAHYEAD